jgi:hypothetical protein
MDTKVMTNVEFFVHMGITVLFTILAPVVLSEIDRYGRITRTFSVSPWMYLVTMVGVLLVGVWFLNYRYERRLNNHRK